MINFSARNITVFFVALVPALIWLTVVVRQHRGNRWLVLFTFLGGMIAAKVILVYKDYWDTTINFIFFKVSLVDFTSNIQALVVNTVLATFVIFLGVGVMEEVAKFVVMRMISLRHFRSIDDVIMLAIVSALGFSFFENTVYFVNHWSLKTTEFFSLAVFRVTIVTMVHVLCSGVLGYYYGMAFFASPVLKIQMMKQQKHPILGFLKRFLNLKSSQVYHDEMLMIGLFTAMLLHGIYDFVLSLDELAKQSEAVRQFQESIHFPLYIPVMLLYFFGGFWYLRHLFEKKELDLKLGLVGTTVMPKEDFAALLEQVRQIKDRMSEEINAENDQ